ncbi:unnamed protein product, partial [marine sediment metagenome]
RVGKGNDAAKAEADFNAYTAWMKKMIGGTKISPITFRPKTGRYSTS